MRASIQILRYNCKIWIITKRLPMSSSDTIFPQSIAAFFPDIAAAPDLATCTANSSPYTLSDVFQQCISYLCHHPRDTDFYSAFTSRLLTLKKDHVFKALKLLSVQLQLELYKDICAEPANYDARDYLNPFRIIFWRKTGMVDCRLTSGTLKKINAHYKEISAPVVSKQAASRFGVFASIFDAAIYNDEEQQHKNPKEAAVQASLEDRAQYEDVINRLL